jgi:hypothetical protein
MARPLKDPKLRMSIDLRVPVTADQTRVLQRAVADYPAGLAAWGKAGAPSGSSETVKAVKA